MVTAKDGRRPICKACDRSWRIAAAARRKAYAEEYRLKNPEKVAATNAAWHKRNSAAQAVKKREYQQANLPAYRARAAKREAAKIQAVPVWADKAKIQGFYDAAARLTDETGIKHSVDHIVPLQSPLVCGLHWEGNMEVMPMASNIAKSNRTWPDCP